MRRKSVCRQHLHFRKKSRTLLFDVWKIMVSREKQERIRQLVAKKNNGKLRYFFIDGDLHRVLQMSKHQNRIIAWNYPKEAKVHYFMTHVKKHMQHAYTIKEAATLLCRDYFRMRSYMIYGDLHTPQRTYTIDEEKKPGTYYLSEDDVLEWHDFFSGKHRGRPRKDGIVRPAEMPTRKELIGMMRGGRQLYVMDEETGEFVPVWREAIWGDI